MKLETPSNENYAVTVVRIKTLTKLTNLDNLRGMPVMGMHAIVGKDTVEGDLALLFPTECQISDEYLRANNLYRHADRNVNPDKVGYFDDNGRVRAVKFKGNVSNAFVMPLSSLYFAYPNYDTLQEGDKFDKINGTEICRKYYLPVKGPSSMPKAEHVARVEEKLFPPHFESPQLLRVLDGLDPAMNVVVTQKLHGTSIRIGRVPVKRSLSLLERLAKRIGLKVQEWEFDDVYGSRKVVKDANNPNQQHYYKEDIWTREGQKLRNMLPNGYIIYGELIGYTSDGAPIQRGYTYDAAPKECKLYVYRVAVVNDQGVTADLSWDAVREFCGYFGLHHVPELLRTTVGHFTEQNQYGISTLDEYMNVSYRKLSEENVLYFRDTPIALSPESPCDEGICVRAEGIIPRIWKVKSSQFLEYETKQLDKGEVDLESQEVNA